MHVDPKGLNREGVPLRARRLGVSLAKQRAEGLDAAIRLEGETLRAEVHVRYATPPGFAKATIAPAWLDGIPTDGTLAAFAYALDPSPTAWNATFDVLDAVDRADPSRANLAPLRLRLNLLGSAAVIKPDVDLWPRLRGVSGFVTADAAGKVDGVVLRLHATDEPSAKRLETLTLPRIARAALGLKPNDPAAPAVLQVRGKPLAFGRTGQDVAIAWGGAIAEHTAAAPGSPLRLRPAPAPSGSPPSGPDGSRPSACPTPHRPSGSGRSTA